MAYKLLQNLIAPNTMLQHLKGEIVDLNPEIAESLVARGIVKEVKDAATHEFGVAGANGSTGGKLVEGATSQVKAPVESTQSLQRTPAESADAAAPPAPEKGQPVSQESQDQLAPDLKSEAPKQNLVSKVKSAVSGGSQPTAEQVAADAAAQN